MKLQSPIRTFEIERDGKPETVRMALNYTAIAKLCDLWEIELDKLDLEKVSPSKMPDLVFAAMYGLNQEATRDDADHFMQAIAIQDLPKVIKELINSSTPPAGDGGAGPRKPPGKHTR